ncbi:hypothetical protein LTS15_004133 [Exophiala xenobiotica]|nr:hypothetical protein LTS15_004133 [Exophiala xenobiotica]
MSRRPRRTTPIKFERRTWYEADSDLPSEDAECLTVAQQSSAYELDCQSEEERPVSTSVIAIWYPGVGWRYGDIQAWRDFPSAEYPPTWYGNPPVASGEPKPYFESALCRLPAELRTEIWKLYIEDNRGWYLNIDKPTWRTCSGRIRRSRGFITRGVENVLQVCKNLKIEFEGCLMNDSGYCYRYNSHENFQDAPWVLGRYGVRLISYLDLYAHNDLLRKPETEYPQLLRILSRDLPNLKWIRFSREYTTDAVRSQQHGHGVIPYQWTYRAVVLLGAWLCLRHKNLDMLTCYLSTDPDEEGDSTDGTLHNWIGVELMRKDVAVVLNAPMIRRTPWSRIASMPASEFAIDPDSESSETITGHKSFKKNSIRKDIRIAVLWIAKSDRFRSTASIGYVTKPSRVLATSAPSNHSAPQLTPAAPMVKMDRLPLEEVVVAGLGLDADVDEDMLGDVEITTGNDGRGRAQSVKLTRTASR